jgi:hypothetical protein
MALDMRPRGFAALGRFLAHLRPVPILFGVLGAAAICSLFGLLALGSLFRNPRLNFLLVISAFSNFDPINRRRSLARLFRFFSLSRMGSGRILAIAGLMLLISFAGFNRTALSRNQ